MRWAHRTPGGWVEGDPPDWAGGEDLRGRDRAQMARHGWHPISETGRPLDSGTTTWDRRLELVRGRVTEVWAPRPWTPAERAAAAAAAAEAASEAKDRAAAMLLLDRLAEGMGTRSDVWPAVKSWSSLAAVKPSDVTTVAGLATIVLWMVPASLLTARAAHKTLRIVLNVTSPDTADSGVEE